MQKRRILTVFLVIAILVIWRQIQKSEEKLIHLTGTTMGTIPYSIKYLDTEGRSFQNEIDSILVAFNNSLSTYISSSEISILNDRDSIKYTSPFMFPVLKMSQEIYEKSNGAFDPTVGPLVNAWGFGKNKKTRMDSSKIDSLLLLVGYDKISFNNHGVSKPKYIKLDFSASAKGYAIDIVADFLNSKEIFQYMVEIGGEVSCKGKNQEGNIWKIGIEKPTIGQSGGDLFATTFVKNRSIATSGNYRNYYEVNGKIVSHTIDPFTGYPSQHSLLSASIYAPNCTLADGYATACMVLGLDKSIEMVERNPEIDAFLIYSDNEGQLRWFISENISNQIDVLE